VIVTSAAYPGKTLQPIGNSADSGAMVVLGNPESGPAMQAKNARHITSFRLALRPAISPKTAGNTAGIL
jgi:hypothetical protein